MGHPEFKWTIIIIIIITLLLFVVLELASLLLLLLLVPVLVQILKSVPPEPIPLRLLRHNQSTCNSSHHKIFPSLLPTLIELQKFLPFILFGEINLEKKWKGGAK